MLKCIFLDTYSHCSQWSQWLATKQTWMKIQFYLHIYLGVRPTEFRGNCRENMHRIAMWSIKAPDFPMKPSNAHILLPFQHWEARCPRQAEVPRMPWVYSGLFKSLFSLWDTNAQRHSNVKKTTTDVSNSTVIQLKLGSAGHSKAHGLKWAKLCRS